MVTIPYYSKIEDMTVEQEDHLSELHDKRVKATGYVNFMDEENPERSGWYRRVGLAPVTNERFKHLRESGRIATKEDIARWAKELRENG